MNITKKLFYTSAIALMVAVPVVQAQAAETSAKTKEVTELVGYNVTEKTVPEKTNYDATFDKIDKDGSGDLNLKEFQNASQLEDDYNVFISMDTDKNKLVSFNEFFDYDKTKGNTQVASELHGKSKVKVRGTNLTSRVYTEDNYYVPVDPVIVDVEDIKK